ncbi:EAL domain-containing protein [Vibrio cincinnatiensis]|uniref:EAL domain, c-di-GMP-specific phosphodiesterase class I (Or its enzymatically inactive variant) n=1 Tax=Vibrio cincinnatiensis DSM 19608 TaxID=1123491 RepID=A0A1T4KIY8_VIBCI|nr:EAL domain-containing protein [Vibrio cincinnatiensis]MCG3721461.1 EAL domain-containing protein [Vibrio cincinnatiensis]MCG3736365.1 EAL domain-containing protein [Vibrio cincinnatiensis]SJZ42379.1 EAL domain, c-di-GMP-specific phosphodiesterase class I (or its enzymatically inactive variant) [Vibrio cincinnatiensis DSM 19608]SUP48585.1 diguanylate cyclase [Vibrio cincinnatiensis]
MKSTNNIEYINNTDIHEPYIKPVFNNKHELSGGEIVINTFSKDERLISLSQMANIENCSNDSFITTKNFLESIIYNFITPHEVNEFNLYININELFLSCNKLTECLYGFCSILLNRDKNLVISLVINDKSTFTHGCPPYGKILRSFRQLGVKICIRSYNGDLSNFHYLSQYNIDSIVIDRRFISALIDDNEHQIRLKNIINLAKDNNMKIVIEGIDTILQYAITSKYRNAYFQGKLLCKAMSLEYFKLQIFESNLQVI